MAQTRIGIAVFIASIVSFFCAPAAAQVCTGWTLVSTSGPGDRWQHAMVYDSLRERMVMFGGEVNGSSYDPQTWVYASGNWAAMMPTPSPSERDSHGMAYDSARDRVVVFGGLGPNGGLDETWEFDGNAWHLVSTEGPTSRFNHGMTYDSRRCRTVLYGGRLLSGGLSDETWEWDGVSWALVATTGPTNPEFSKDHLTYDARRGKVILATIPHTANETWEWDGAVWTKITAPGPDRSRIGLAFNNRRAITQIFGGVDIPNNARFDELWDWNGKKWTLNSVAPNPGESTHVAMAYNASRDVTVVFGGSNDSGIHADTWELDDPLPGIQSHPQDHQSPTGGTTTLSVSAVDATGYQWRRNGVPLSNTVPYTDVNTPNLRIVGINSAAGIGEFDCIVSNACGEVISRCATVSLEDCHPEWSTPATSPWAKRVQHAMAEALNNQIILFGGFDEFGNALGDTWRFDGATWTLHQLASPSARSRHSMAFHQTDGVTVLLGGEDNANNVLGDLWLWNGNAWVGPFPGGPSDAAGGAMAYDSTSQRIVYFGGTNNSGIYYSDTFEWSLGTGWVALPVTGPKGRFGHAMAFDPVAGTTVMHGGFTADGDSDETWEYNGIGWRLRSTEGPAASRDTAMAYDQRLQAIVLTGDPDDDGDGETWRWDSTEGRWTEITDTDAPARRAHAAAYHTQTQKLVITGGFDTSGGPLFNSHTTMMSPPDGPAILSSPPDDTFKVNEPMSLAVTASGSNLTYQWCLNNVPLTNSSRISGAQSPTLIVDPTVMADAGVYECKVTNACGTATAAVAIEILCLADVNHDGSVTPADFTAWINAFNNNILPECDQNCDSACTPTDFTAWIANYNAGCP